MSVVGFRSPPQPLEQCRQSLAAKAGRLVDLERQGLQRERALESDGLETSPSTVTFYPWNRSQLI